MAVVESEINWQIAVAIPTFALSSIQSCGVGYGALLATDIDSTEGNNQGMYYCAPRALCLANTEDGSSSLAPPPDGISSLEAVGELIPTRCVFLGEKVYAWRRGAYLRDWLDKWPLKSQIIGRKTRRYFRLVDNKLLYYTSEERALDAKPPDSATQTTSSSSKTNSSSNGDLSDAPSSCKEALEITAVSSVKHGTHFTCRCVSLKTGKNVLWFTADNEDIEELWRAEIQFVIEQYQRKKSLQRCLEMDYENLANQNEQRQQQQQQQQSLLAMEDSQPAPTITESLWFHDPPGYKLACVDATEWANRAERTGQPQLVTAALFGKPGDYYLELDHPATASPADRVKYKIPDVPKGVSISLLKIIDEQYFILCGSRGWIGIYDAQAQCMMLPNQSSHCLESKILSVDILIPANAIANEVMIATGDRLGGLALWTLDRSPIVNTPNAFNTTLNSSSNLKLKKFVDLNEPIMCVRFVPNRQELQQEEPQQELELLQRSQETQLFRIVVGTEKCCRLLDITLKQAQIPSASAALPLTYSAVVASQSSSSSSASSLLTSSSLPSLVWQLSVRCVLDDAAVNSMTTGTHDTSACASLASSTVTMTPSKTAEATTHSTPAIAGNNAQATIEATAFYSIRSMTWLVDTKAKQDIMTNHSSSEDKSQLQIVLDKVVTLSSEDALENFLLNIRLIVEW